VTDPVEISAQDLTSELLWWRGTKYNKQQCLTNAHVDIHGSTTAQSPRCTEYKSRDGRDQGCLRREECGGSRVRTLQPAASSTSSQTFLNSSLSLANTTISPARGQSKLFLLCIIHMQHIAPVSNTSQQCC